MAYWADSLRKQRWDVLSTDSRHVNFVILFSAVVVYERYQQCCI